MRFTSEQPRRAPLTATPVVLELEAEYIPLLFSALEKYHNRYFWASDIDYENGVQGLTRLERALITNMTEPIVNAIDRLYRLIDTSYNGTIYEQNGAGPDGLPTVEPAIPVVPPASTVEPNAMRAHVGRLWHLAENAATAAVFEAGAGIEDAAALPAALSWASRLLAVQGETGGFLGIGDVPVQLKDLLKNSRINTEQDKTNVGDAIDTVSDAISIGDNIKDAITGFLSGAAQLGTDGGVIAAQLAVGTAQVQLLKRLIRAIDGAEILTPPTDNVLQALRGDTPAAGFRSVIDNLGFGLYDNVYGVGAATWLATQTGRQGDVVDGFTTNQQLNEIRLSLLKVVGVGSGNELPEGSPLRIVIDTLDCICEGVTGTPLQYPTPESVACADYTHLALVANVTFAANGLAFEEGGVYPYARFTLQPDTTDVFPVTIFGGNPALRVINTPRNLCIAVVLPIGTVNPGISGAITPLRIGNGGSGARPTLSLDETPNDIIGFFEENTSDDNQPIGYTVSIGVTPGELVGVTARIYVFSGNVG